MKTINIKELAVDDWFTLDSCHCPDCTFRVDSKDDCGLYVTSPAFLTGVTVYLSFLTNAEVILIGKTRPSKKFKFLGWIPGLGKVIHPYKMIPLDRWLTAAIQDWVSGK